MCNLCISNHFDSKMVHTNHQIYEMDLKEKPSIQIDSDFDRIEPDPIISSLLDKFQLEDIEKANDNMRNTERISSLFNFYRIESRLEEAENEQSLIDTFRKVELPSAAKTNSILVKCTNLKLDFEVEPLFATMALYDLKSRKKISESFHFDFNNDYFRSMIRKYNRHEDMSTTSKSCIFNITWPSNDIYLVVRLEKVFQQGDLNECVEPYLKFQQTQSNNEKANLKEKQHLHSLQFCDKLGKYRMPFAWTAINLMNILNVNLGNNCEDLLSSNSLFSLNSNSQQVNKTSSLDRSSEYNFKHFNDNLNNKSNKAKMSAQDDSIIGSQNSNSNKTRRSFEFESIDVDLMLRNKLNNFKPISISINNFFKQDPDKLSDEDLYKILTELKKSPNLIK